MTHERVIFFCNTDTRKILFSFFCDLFFLLEPDIDNYRGGMESFMIHLFRYVDRYFQEETYLMNVG